MSIVYALLAISFLVFVHELGHYLAARLCNIPVLAFGIGFGPAILKFARGGTTYRLNLLPLGGYVTTPATETKQSPVRVRLLFYSAGILMNVLTAIVFLTVLFSVTGLPHLNEGGLRYGDPIPLWKGVWHACEAAFLLMGQMFATLWQLIGGTLSINDLSGPVQIVQATGHASELGGAFFLYFMTVLSLNLAVINLLPIPSLDGSHLLFTLLEVVRRGKRISMEREALVHFVGILVMFALMIVVTVKDLGWLW
jgi:membrane-associated protease RseP (regulator of RpoE activity)